MWFNRHILTPVSFQSGNWPHLPSLLCKIVYQIDYQVCQSLKSVYQVCQFIKFASQFFANMLFSIVLLIILAYAIKHWEVSVKMSVNDWKLELFRQRQRQTKTDKDKDRNRQIQRQTKSKTKTKAKTGQKQTSNARTKTNIQLQKPTPKLSSHYTDGFYSTFGDIITLP